MKSNIQSIHEKIQQYPQSKNRFDAFIQGYMDYLNEDKQDEVFCLEGMLERYFEDYHDEILFEVLVSLFERGIGAGSDFANQKEVFQFANGTFFHKDVTPREKAQITWLAFQQTKVLHPEDDEHCNNRSILQFGIVLWSEDILEKKLEKLAEDKESIESKTLRLKKQCALGDKEACLELGVIYKKIKQDDVQAREFYQKACDLGSGEGCNYLAWMYLNSEGIKQDLSKAKEYFQKSCDLGDVCARGNFALRQDNEGDQRLLRAQELYEKARDLSKGLREHDLSWMDKIPEVEPDFSGNNELYAMLCGLGIGSGCFNLGVLYEYGREVEIDLSKAIEFYQKACELGEGLGCNNLGIMYEKGKGVEQDYSKAKELYEKACELGEGLGCFNLGLAYEEGKGVEQDLNKAREFYQKACELGYEKACEYVLELSKED